MRSTMDRNTVLALENEATRGQGQEEESISLSELKNEIKELQARKGSIARQFKSPDLSEEHLDNLKQQMKVTSQALDQAQAWLKQQLNKSRQKTVVEPSLPRQFQPAPQALTERFEVLLLPEDELAQWRSYTERSDRASAYHQPTYLDHIKQVFGHSSQVLVARDENGQILGGMPITFMRSRLFGEFGVSLPYFNYGGPLSQYRNVEQALLEKAGTLLQQEGLSHIEVRTTTEGLPFRVSSKKVSMILPLPDSDQALDRQLGSKVRAQYKKTQNEDPDIRFAGLELLDDFYRVFAENMRDLGTPVYSKAWFQALLADPEVKATLAIGYLNNKAVSAGFLIGHGELMEIPWASTLQKVNATNMNMWFYRQILGFAIKEGYAFFDFGRSTVGAGTYRFKKQWGAKPIQHYWYYLTPPGTEPKGTSPDSPKFRLMIAIWQRLPVWLTRLIGPAIVKNLP